MISLPALGRCLIVTAPFFIGQALAQPMPMCSPKEMMHQYLKAQFSEEPIAQGIATNGNLFEVYASRDGATWTIVETTPTGGACAKTAGRFWEHILRGEQINVR